MQLHPDYIFLQRNTDTVFSGVFSICVSVKNLHICVCDILDFPPVKGQMWHPISPTVHSDEISFLAFMKKIC